MIWAGLRGNCFETLFILFSWALGCRIDGGQAEYVRVPYADQGLNKIPDSVSDEQALFVGDISVGASNDIDRASKLARDMVARYGMCEKLGTVSYLGDDEVFIGRDYQTTKSYSEKFAGTIDDEVKLLMDKAYQHCEQILRDNADKLMEVVEFLLQHETMTGEQFADCMEGRQIGQASETAMLDQQAKENTSEIPVETPANGEENPAESGENTEE